MYRYFFGDEDPDYNSDTLDSIGGHGTHVCGSVAGNDGLVGEGGLGRDEPGEGAFASAYNGGAPNAKIAFDDISGNGGMLSPLPDFLDSGLLQPTYDYSGARTFSWSWGVESPLYDSAAMQADIFLSQNSDAVLLVACGNSGPDYQTIGSPATAKNIISVASSLNSMNNDRFLLSVFSSSGPVFFDHRIKPDVTCPGQNIFSAWSSGSEFDTTCSVTEKSGTSMATPHCAAAVVLLRQYFEQGFFVDGSINHFSGFSPSGSLVKGCMIHSAASMSGKGYLEVDYIPNMYVGWGLVSLADVMMLPNGTGNVMYSDYYDRMIFDSEKVFRLCYRVRSSNEEVQPISFRATVSWTDPPSVSGSETVGKLVNDIDLVVIKYPENLEPPEFWVGNGARMVGAKQWISVWDRVNPVERVVVPVPAAGLYSVIVSGHSVVVGPQEVSLIVTGNGVGVDPEVCPEESRPMCPMGCNERGVCGNNGKCTCIFPAIGVDCGENISLVQTGVNHILVVPLHWSLMGVSPPNNSRWRVSVAHESYTFENSKGAPISTVYIRFGGGIPSLSSHDVRLHLYNNSQVLYSEWIDGDLHPVTTMGFYSECCNDDVSFMTVDFEYETKSNSKSPSRACVILNQSFEFRYLQNHRTLPWL